MDETTQTQLRFIENEKKLSELEKQIEILAKTAKEEYENVIISLQKTIKRVGVIERFLTGK